MINPFKIGILGLMEALTSIKYEYLQLPLSITLPYLDGSSSSIPWLVPSTI